MSENCCGMDEDTCRKFHHMMYKKEKENELLATERLQNSDKSYNPDVSALKHLQQVKEFKKNKVLGQIFIVIKLKTETGIELNGEKCEVTGYNHNDPWHGRYHCKMLTGTKKGKAFLLKYINLANCLSGVLLNIKQPLPSKDLFEPADLLINMIIGWTSAKCGSPSPTIEKHHFHNTPDAQFRSFLICRYVTFHANIDQYVAGLRDDIIRIDMPNLAVDANLTGLIEKLEKKDPHFFKNSFSAYYVMEMRALRFPDKADKAEAHLVKKGGFTNVKKNKKRLAEALTYGLWFMIIEIMFWNDNMRTGKGSHAEETKGLQTHNILLSAANDIDVSKPLQCGRVIANGLPAIKELIAKVELTGNDTESYFKAWTAIQAPCYGDNIVDFRRFTFGLAGGSNLPDCSCCLEPIEKTDMKIAKLDCQHLFHEECIAERFDDGRKTCPACQEPHVGLVSYDLSRQLQTRYAYYIAFGMCERCQSFLFERKNKCSVDENVFIIKYHDD